MSNAFTWQLLQYAAEVRGARGRRCRGADTGGGVSQRMEISRKDKWGNVGVPLPAF